MDIPRGRPRLVSSESSPSRFSPATILMPQVRRQRTVRGPTHVRGTGYWSGRDITVEFRPAAVDAGVTFVRRDLGPQARVAVSVENCVEVPRRTALVRDGVRVEMIEHVMAALAGLQIDNCEVWVDTAEMPGLDGSCLAYVEALDKVGAVEQPAPRTCLAVLETIRLGDANSWIEAAPSTAAGCELKFLLDYGDSNPIGRQECGVQLGPDAFRRELASARTFLLKHEAEALQAQGLAGHVSTSELLVFDDRGPVGNTLRFANECARHKTLDLVGDLALAGCDLDGKFTAFRSGHRLNAELVRALLRMSGGHRWRASA